MEQNREKLRIKSVIRQKEGIKIKSVCGGGRRCTQCGTSIDAAVEICPECGTYLDETHCSFCGEEMEADDRFCPECGSPRGGLTCSRCGTLNFRSFCRCCNEPLDERARQELRRAEQDPIFQSINRLAEEMADMEAFLADDADPEPHAASQRNEKLLSRYQDLLTENAVVVQSAAASPADRVNPFARQGVSKEELATLYREKVAQMQQLMDSLSAEAGSTPQMQRDYYSARKIKTLRRAQTPSCWQCNYCGAYHAQPSQCSYPELGGHWIYEEIETYEYK